MCIRDSLKTKVDFSSLKYFMYGAAPMSVEKLKQAIEVIGPCLLYTSDAADERLV